MVFVSTGAKAFLCLRDEHGQMSWGVLTSEPLVIGRSSEADLTLDSHAVSRRHAEILCDPFGRWSVRDLGSRNGTFVNGVPTTEQVFQPGDTIEITGFTLVLELTGAGAETPAGPGSTDVTISDTGTATINTQDQIGSPKIDAKQLFVLQDFGRRLITVAASDCCAG